MAVTVTPFGTYPDGREIKLYTISNKKGMQAAVSDLGAVLVKLMAPDKDGVSADLVLGFGKGEDYLVNVPFFGAVIGPNANRIAKASFSLDGTAYSLDANDGVNNLHSHREKRSEERRVGKECL